jgi:hypothetical protein
MALVRCVRKWREEFARADDAFKSLKKSAGNHAAHAIVPGGIIASFGSGEVLTHFPQGGAFDFTRPEEDSAHAMLRQHAREA